MDSLSKCVNNQWHEMQNFFVIDDCELQPYLSYLVRESKEVLTFTQLVISATLDHRDLGWCRVILASGIE